MGTTIVNGVSKALKRLAALGLAAAISTASLQAWASAESGAINTVQDYMALLFIGDTAGMSNHLDTSMRNQRGAILSNPSYGKTLAKAYSGARYNVVSSEQLSADRASVTVKITLASKDTLHVQFELTDEDNGYKIVSER